MQTLRSAVELRNIATEALRVEAERKNNSDLLVEELTSVILRQAYEAAKLGKFLITITSDSVYTKEIFKNVELRLSFLGYKCTEHNGFERSFNSYGETLYKIIVSWV